MKLLGFTLAGADEHNKTLEFNLSLHDRGWTFFQKQNSNRAAQRLQRFPRDGCTDSCEPDNAVQKRCSLVVLYAMTSLIAEAENQRSLSEGAHPRHEVSRMDSRYNPVTFAVA